MSRSPEKARDESPLERRMSVSSSHSRPGVEEAPAKRARTDTKKEDKARGKRLFGNLLGTLQKFQKDDKTSRTSEAAKRREELSSRIANKLRSETNLQRDISDADKELKALKIATESAEYVLKHKEVALTARHAALRPVSKFLHTSKPPPAPLIFEASLLNPSPIPLAKGPSRDFAASHSRPPLYFLPKILTPSQEDTLRSRLANIDELISEEITALEKERTTVIETAKSNRTKMEEVSTKLAELRRQAPPSTKSGGGRRERDRDDFGRTPREEMDTKPDRDSVGADVDMAGGDDREAGVQIKGEDGDIEVEY
ncbi:hypothetical protein CI109_103527 [Kwoniella shandongensis]|uniref:Uncharacterized protein n=1 Tax=Kwoniella shandongensis TaxID=1734106 RepID=A0A5M6BVZ3_9TREE|nr:uncharacterized protein CI109_004571 [Kwoniella shandongensis]KAA5527036.1 hypothetical protein CI109_004571 [Kwoniella shandongensis]